MRRRDTRLLSDSEARTAGWMGDLEESLSQSHSSGSFIHSCLPEAGLPGCPCRAPLLATSHLRAARPWCPGAGWRWCGGRGLWWCAGARGPGCMVHAGVMLVVQRPGGARLPCCSRFQRKAPQGAPQLLCTELFHLRNLYFRQKRPCGSHMESALSELRFLLWPV